jgi:5-(hydroxymethyl)furfural/furfural oxidase
MDTTAQSRLPAPFAADIAIVGGGAAGCVLAARLTEDPRFKVILFEAGRDIPPDAPPEDVADVFPLSYSNPAYFWPKLEATHRKGNSPAWYPQARVLGGGSSVMGMLAPRGLRADFDSWGETGVEGWRHDDLLPYFKRLERDLNFPGGVHGDRGPIPIMRQQRSTWAGFTEALAKAAEKRGLSFKPDLNGSDGDGTFEMPLCNDGKRRYSSASAYLNKQVRERDNLRIMTETEVSGIVMDGPRAVGVNFRQSDRQFHFTPATWVIVSAGAIYSPILLKRAGIGPADELAAHGITVVVDNPQVGRNLQNHPYIHLGAVVRPEARHDPVIRSYAHGCIRLSTHYKDAPPGDIFMSLISRSGPRARDICLGMISVGLYSPFSRGQVTLSRKDPGATIELQMLEDERDRARLILGARMARELLSDDLVKPTVQETFMLPAQLPMRLLNQPGLKSNLFSLSLFALLNMKGGVRRYVLSNRLGPGRFLDRLTDADAFDELVIRSVTSMAHSAGTCAIGRVVDASTAVKGTEGLFVADASIMPTIPRANTNTATLMIAEKASDEIRTRIWGH